MIKILYNNGFKVKYYPQILKSKIKEKILNEIMLKKMKGGNKDDYRKS